MQYRAKNPVVEATRFSKVDPEPAVAWADGDAYRGPRGTLHVETSAGTMIASDGDYVVRLHGNVTVMTAEAFERFYEPCGGN